MINKLITIYLLCFHMFKTDYEGCLVGGSISGGAEIYIEEMGERYEPRGRVSR